VLRAYELNNPLIACRTTPHRGSQPKEHSFVSVSPSNLVVTALKKAEDSSNDLILRFYEASGKPTVARIKLGLKASSWAETDLAERPIKRAQRVRGVITLPVGRYEIKTIRIRR